MIAAMYLSSNGFPKNFIKIILATSSIAVCYGFLQVLKLDPVSWSSPPPAAFSTFGNQNFLSAFIGISLVASLGYLFTSKPTKIRKGLFLILILSSLLMMYFTKSSQGYLIFAFGVVVVHMIWTKKSKKYSKYNKFYVTIFFIGIVIVVLDVLQKVPWNSFLYEPSISARGDYWRAAWRTSLDHPIFGVGPDGFFDFYRLNRDFTAVLNRGFEIRADSTHNIFLEFLVSGGVPLFLIFSAIIYSVGKSSLDYIRKSQVFDPIHSGIFAAWLAFLIQALISVSQISLVLVGWILSGILLGYDKMSQVPIPKEKLKLKGFAVVGLATMFGLGVGLPPLLVDAKFRQGISTGNASLLLDISDDWPQSSDRISAIGSILRINNFPQEAIQVLKSGIEFNPRHFEFWRELSLCPGISESEKLYAEMQARRLNPSGTN